MKNQSITITPENLMRYFSKSYSTCLIYQDELSIELGKKKGMRFICDDIYLYTNSTYEEIIKNINPDKNTMVRNQLVLNFPLSLV